MRRGATIVASVLAGSLLAGGAVGQGVSPLRKQGPTPSDRKAFYITIKNPYDKSYAFKLDVMEPDFAQLAENAWVFPKEIIVAPKRGRRVTLIMEIPDDATERTVSLCVSAPGLKTAVLPRVCGTYTGFRHGTR